MTTSGNAAGVGQPYSLNVLANDFLGDPPATIVDDTFDPVGPCTGFSFNAETGVLSGTPTILGDCVFNYVLGNVAGRNGSAVVVEVAELRAPSAFGASEQVTAGEPFSFDLFDFDVRGVPQATITSHTFVPGGACEGLTFDPATGVLSGTPVGLGTPTGDVCDFEYTLSNAAGSDSSDVTVTIFPGPIAPVAVADTRQAADGRPVAVFVLDNDFLGHPRATITSHTFDAGVPECAGLSFDPLFGVLSGTPVGGLSRQCQFDYVLSNSEGTSTGVVVVDIGVLPVAVEDGYASGEDGIPAAVGQPFSVNVLANDFLGDPPATIVAASFNPVGGCSDFSFDEVTGVFSGTSTTPFAFCGFNYVLRNSAGSSAAAAFVEVLPLAAPNAFFDVEQATAGEPFSFNVLTDDELGHPPATITSHTFTSTGGCSGLSFDPATGLLSGTPVVGVCDFDYVISNPAGSDTAGATVTFFAGPTAPVAAADTRQVTAGQALGFGVLGNDFLGHPQATITSNTFDAAAAGCGGLTFNPTNGLLSGTPTAGAGSGCSFDYTISNSAGTSTATVLVEVVAPLAATAIASSTTTTSTTTPPPTTTTSTTTMPPTTTATSTTTAAPSTSSTSTTPATSSTTTLTTSTVTLVDSVTPEATTPSDTDAVSSST